MEPTAPPVAETPDMSLTQRIWGALVSPRIVFEAVRARPRVLGVLVVLAVLFVATGFLQRDISLQQQLEQLDARPDMTEEGRIQAEKSIRFISTYVVPLAFPVGLVVGMLVVGGALLFVGNVILGGEGRFKQYFAGAVHVQIVSIPALLVRVPMVRATGDLQTPTSLAGLLSPDDRGSLLYNALSQLDVFGLWQVALAVIMVSVMARVPTRKAAYGVVGAWLVWTVILVLGQTFLSGLGGS